MNKTLEKVIGFIRQAIADHPIIEEGKGFLPSVYYQNGNDGTDFDWACNGRTCEFFVFYNTGEDALGYVKAYVTKNGNVEGYVWDTERYSEGVRLDPMPLATQAEEYEDGPWEKNTLAKRRAKAFRNWLMRTRDKESIYDEPIAAL